MSVQQTLVGIESTVIYIELCTLHGHRLRRGTCKVFELDLVGWVLFFCDNFAAIGDMGTFVLSANTFAALGEF